MKCNPNYKGKNYDPNFQAKHVEATHTAFHNSKQQQHSSTMASQYKTTYHKPASTYGASNNNIPLTSSSDIVGEVTLKTSVDGYQLLKVNEMIKNAVACERSHNLDRSFRNIYIVPSFPTREQHAHSVQNARSRFNKLNQSHSC